jgi:WD40 repeat protein/class 3 adenylate cyclase
MTFLMTDIEGSTRLWDFDPEGMAVALVVHDRVVEATVASHRGSLVKARGEGDSTFSVFEEAEDAVSAAVEVRERLEKTTWPGGIAISVRCGLHTGEAIARDGDFYGPTVNRAARVRALAVGRQILVSATTAECVRDELPPSCALVDLGTYELKGLTAPEQVFAVAQPGDRRYAVTPSICPYPGLVAFQVSDHERFVGREAITARLVRRLLATGRAVVVGASGSGKSSLIRAGVVPALPVDRAVAVFTPGSHPLDALAAARGGSERDPVLVVDQLEEVFTMCVDVEERRAFLDLLVGVANQRSGLVVALRADFYGRFTEHPGFARLISSEHELLSAMSASELREVIELPARRVGLQFESGLVDVIVEGVEGEPGALPLVAHVLRETWRRREGRALTHAGYAAAGGVHGAIALTAESIYEHLTPSQRQTMRGVFLRLTELGEEGNDHRRRASLAEVVAAGGEATEVLEILADARLVTIDVDTVELAHEALIREWPRLRDWIEEDREGLRLLRELGAAAEVWEALEQDPGVLYRGARLAATLDWLGGDPSIEPTTREREFVDASRLAQEREIRATRTRLRHARQLLAAIAVALVVALVAGALALVQQRRADDAAQRSDAASHRAVLARLVADSRALRTEDPQLSALLAATASRLADSAPTRGALLDAITADPRLRGTITGRTRPYQTVTYTPDGSYLVVRAPAAVEVFDVQRRRAVGPPIRLPSSGGGLAVSPDGTVVAAGASNVIHFFDVRTGRPSGPNIRTSASVVGLTFTPDGRSLVSASGTYGDTTPVATDQTVQFWDAISRRPLAIHLNGHSAAVYAIALTPDGRVLATGGNDNLVVLHDTATGITIATLKVETPVFSLAFSPDGARLVVGQNSQDVVVFDAHTGERVGAPLAADGFIQAVGYSADGTRVLTSDLTTVVWDADSLIRIGTSLPSGRLNTAVAFAPRGHTFAVVGYGGIVTLWDPDASALVSRAVPGSATFGGLYSPDGSTLAVPGVDRVTLYDARTLRPRFEPFLVPSIPTPLPLPVAIAFSGDSRRLAVTGLTGTVTVVDSRTGLAVGTPFTVTPGLFSIAWRPNSPTIAVGDNQGIVRLLNADSGKARELKGLSYPVLNLAFSPDGRRLIAGTGVGDALVFDHLERAKPRAQLLPNAERRVVAAAFSRDGSLLVTGGVDGTLQLRDGRTLRPRGPRLPVTSGPVYAADFSRDGRTLAVTDLAPSFRLVDIASWQPVGPALTAGQFMRPSFHSGGHVVARSQTTGTEVLNLDLARWRAAACRLAGRNLTATERREYLSGIRPTVACPPLPTQR